MEALLEEGCIIVATSNRAPWDLNRHGLHEDLFGHFVQNLLEACHPYQLSAEQDYRRLLVNFIYASHPCLGPSLKTQVPICTHPCTLLSSTLCVSLHSVMHVLLALLCTIETT